MKLTQSAVALEKSIVKWESTGRQSDKSAWPRSKG
jgi:hypothetical protein